MLRLICFLSSALVLALASLAVPTDARAVNLTSPAGHLFDCIESSGCYLSNGTSDAYDGMYYLNVNGTRYTSSSPAMMTMGGRQIEMAERPAGTLMMRRIFYVPTAASAPGAAWGRFLDIVRNPTGASVTATIMINGNLGSDSSTRVTSSSSGDATFSVADDWFGTDDTGDGSGDPSLAHVIAGPGGLVRPSAASISRDNPTWTFTTNIPAGGQVAVLTFAIQHTNRAMAHAEAMRLTNLPAEALTGISSFLPDVINFPVGGAPVIRFTGAGMVDEGTDVMLDVMVTDLEMDPVTWSWDLDDDGSFGEAPMVTTHRIMGTDTDGPENIRIGVEASDGTETRTRYVTIDVQNVAPTITSMPPSEPAFVGAEWRYDLIWDDPAGMRDLPDFTFIEAPPGMTSSRGGTITWTPTVTDRDMTFPVTVQVDDTDGGTDMQSFEVVVSNNRAPTDPVPFRPINRDSIMDTMPTLVIQNGSDPDGDRLSYFFQIDNNSAFGSTFQVESPEIVEMSAGQTSWTVPTNLMGGQWFWRVKVTDGQAEGPWVNAVFIVNDGTVDAGAGGGDGGVGSDGGTITPPPPPRRRGEGCCHVAGTDEPVPALPWLVGALVLVVTVRRRWMR